MTRDKLVKDIHDLAENIREGYLNDLKLGVIMAGIHAYQPLLYAGSDCQVTVRPDILNENEKKVVERLKELVDGIEKRLHNTDPNLRLHAYILSVTPVEKIDDGKRTMNAWRDDGVYFLNEPDCLKQVIANVLEREILPLNGGQTILDTVT